LDEFLSRDDAPRLVKAASFEEVFFTVKAVGLADALELLPFVTGRQVRGFIDLDCWRKDQFVRKPLMEWIAAFVQSGPEDTAKALSGIDEYVLALYLKDIVHVYEVDRDDPPETTQMILTPDSRFGVEPMETGETATIAMLMLDALFKYNPKLGTTVLTLVRYTTRLELEETAYDNKTRRLEVHGFVDYYEAMSIYAGPSEKESPAARDIEVEAIPGEESTGNLPSVFADSLAGAVFLQKALSSIADPDEAVRVSQELTALGNRVLSANLINMGELEGVRPALEEMRDILNIGLELLTGRDPDRAADALSRSYVQTIFKVGFDRIARLRNGGDLLAALPGFQLSRLDPADQEFVEGLRRFKPALAEGGGFRTFRSFLEVEAAQSRLQALTEMAKTLLSLSPDVPATFAQVFNTATLRAILHDRFDATPLDRKELGELQFWLAKGYRTPSIEVPPELLPFSQRWWNELEMELTPLVGKTLDPRFIQVILVKL
jgi:hypothetical protein